MKHSELKKVLTAAGYTLTAERRYDVDRTRRAYEVRKDGALVAEFEGVVVIAPKLTAAPTHDQAAAARALRNPFRSAFTRDGWTAAIEWYATGHRNLFAPDSHGGLVETRGNTYGGAFWRGFNGEPRHATTPTDSQPFAFYRAGQAIRKAITPPRGG